MGLWLKQGDDLVPVGGGGGGGSFDGEHVLTGDPANPPAELQVGQLLYDGDPSTGGGGSFDGEHVPTGDPTDPATLDIVDEGQLLFDGVESDGSGGGPHNHDEYALAEHDHDEFVHDHDYLPLAGGTLTGDLEVHSENRSVRIFDSGANNYAEIGFTTRGVTGPANGRLTGNAVIIRTGGSRETMQDAFAALSNGNVEAYNDLQVDGRLIVTGGTGAPGTMKSVAGRNILQIQPDEAPTPTLNLHGDNDASSDTMSIKGSDGNYMIRLHGGGLFQVFGEIQDHNGPVRSFAIADGINTRDVLERAETATMPAPDEGVATADVESLTVNEVVTAMLAKIKELSAEIEELKGA
jgi:hypothetical protein